VPGICCVGELMWDFHVERGTLETGESFRRVPGGAAANVALAIADLGGVAAVAGVVARDAFGAGLRARLGELGLDVTAVAERTGRTGMVFIEHPASGQDRYLSYRPSFGTTSALTLPQAWKRSSLRTKVLHVAALDPDWIDPATFARLAGRALSRGARLTIDVNARPRAWRRRRSIPRPFRAMLAKADVVKASHEDLVMLGLEKGLVASDARAALGIVGTLVVTRGAATCDAAGPWGQVRRRPARLKARRTVGAGDAFCARLLSAVHAEAPATTRAWRDTLGACHAHAAAWLTSG
jgi:fructokinase